MSKVNFIHFKTLTKFNERLSAGELKPEQIAFIQDVNYIWTHNNFYKGTPEEFNMDNIQDKLISGTNIKTINGESLLGEGNVVISGGEGGTAPAPTTEDKIEVLGLEEISHIGDSVFAKYIYVYSVDPYFQGTTHLVINNWFLTLLEKIKTMYIILINYKTRNNEPAGYRLKIDRQCTVKGLYINNTDAAEILIPPKTITTIVISKASGPVGYMVNMSLTSNNANIII